MMKDFTTNNYCDYLWISDLLSLKKGTNNEFTALLKRSGKEKTVTISNVIIFGTVVEMKEIGERGTLYLIDDGTGIITCKYNDRIYNEVFDTIHEEERQILNDTFNKTLDSSEMNYTMTDDDSVFNDYSLQMEEAAAVQKNTLKALHSIWVDIEDSFSNMVAGLKIGDTVVIYGRLYNYFNMNQIHVNVMRQIDLKEEMILIHYKLEDGYNPVGGLELLNNGLSHHVHLIENNRRSGILTFDHIQPLDMNEVPASKFIVSEENFCDVERKSRKRKSIVMPHLQGSMTFDTLANLNESGHKSKLVKR